MAEYAAASETEPVIGIDLGTTNSCIGVWDAKAETVHIATTKNDQRTIPSVVCFHKGDVLVGADAKRKLVSQPASTIYNSKRVIGRPYSHVRAEDIEGWTFDLVCGERDRPRYRVEINGVETLVSPEEVGALILAHLKEVAEAFVGREVTRVVITVPAYFTESQRRATRDAGVMAGLDVVRLLPEPTAAALAFGLDRKLRREGPSFVLVFDMGGGTFDVSVLELDGGGSFVTKAVTGNFHLGGEDFDDLVLQWVVAHDAFPLKGKPLPPKVRQKLRKLCEEAKRELSETHETVIEFELQGEEVAIELTRGKFESLCSPLFESALADVEEALRLAGVAKRDVDSIVLVGGSTRIPRIQQMLQMYFDGKALWCGVNPDEAVAWGATALAAALAAGRRQTTGCTAPSQAPVAAASLPLTSLKLMTVTPITLGIELSNGTMDVLIPRGSKIPQVRSDEYTTSVDGQKSVAIKVYEGEHTECARANYLLGKFSLPVERAGMGVSRVHVSFEITAEGIFKVTAKDVKTGKEISVNMENTNLTGDEKDAIIASVKSERACFRSLLSRLYGKAAEAGNTELTALCTEQLEWLQSYPEAPRDEIVRRHRRLELVGAPVLGAEMTPSALTRRP